MAWLETLINGALLGGLYGLLGIGLALVFGTMRVVNIAHGEFMVLSAFFAVMLVSLFPSVHPLLMLIPVVAASFVVGYLYQATIVNRVTKSPDPLAPLLLTFGVSIILRNVMVEIFGADVRSIQLGELSRSSLEFFGLSIGVMPLLTLILAVVLFLLLQSVLKRTKFGRIVRATADRRDIVRLFGVKPDRVYNYVMGLSLALGAIGGVLLAVRSSFTPFSGRRTASDRLRGRRARRPRIVLGRPAWRDCARHGPTGRAQIRSQCRVAVRPSAVLRHAVDPACRSLSQVRREADVEKCHSCFRFLRGSVHGCPHDLGRGARCVSPPSAFSS